MAKKAKKTAVKKTKVAGKTAARKTTGKTKSVKTASRTVASSRSALTAAPGKAAHTIATRVAEYKLFTEDSVRGLEDQVNYHIKKGWAPVGGVVLQGNSTFTQAMVRHEH